MSSARLTINPSRVIRCLSPVAPDRSAALVLVGTGPLGPAMKDSLEERGNRAASRWDRLGKVRARALARRSGRCPPGQGPREVRSTRVRNDDRREWPAPSGVETSPRRGDRAVARRKVDQYFRAAAAGLVRETGRPVGLADGDLAVNGSTPHDGVIADADETLIFGAALPPLLAPGQLPRAAGNLAVNGSTPHDGVIADADETLIFGAALPPLLAPGQLPRAAGNLGANDSTRPDGAALDRQRSPVGELNGTEPARLDTSSSTPSLGEHWATWGAARNRARTAGAPVRSAPGTLVPQRRVWWSRLTTGPWPLLCILAVQAALSLRLLWTNTAFQDEALYLWAGHEEWAHWLHGSDLGMFRFSWYFSGAPIVYPPLGAIADHIGGLAAARLLSLAFMLGATVFLHGMTRRLFGRGAAFFAAALFASTAATEFLGAFATYDAPAIFFLALATWLGVRASGSRLLARLPLLGCASVTLALADATKYMSVLFNPVVIAVVVLSTIWVRGSRAGAATAAVMTAVTCVLITIGLAAGGSPYLHAIRTNTLKPQGGTIPIPGVLVASSRWIGIVALLALIGVAAVMFNFRGWTPKALGVVLAGAIFLSPVSQARIHLITSLFKHAGFGAWFACAVAGYAVASLERAVPPVKAAGAFRAGLAAVAVSGIMAAVVAGNHFREWPASSSFIAALRPVITHTAGPIAVSEDDIRVIYYYLPGEAASHQIVAPTFFSFVNPETGVRRTGAAAYAEAIRQHWFGVIALPFWGEQNTDKAIQADVERYGGYRLVNVIPYTVGGRHSAYRIWVRGSLLPRHHYNPRHHWSGR
jgi:hypothetical protein